ncbi:ribosome assembly protein METTL17, mitochondrial [Centruroides vittatus]|uniref:ribosome assembly protein METTL17, mitochondrial n=1 Tax=Centruroides vittatus TaxID=120091 RepID=UPI00350FD2F8
MRSMRYHLRTLLNKKITMFVQENSVRMSSKTKFTALTIPEVEEQLNSNTIKHRKHPGLRRINCVKLPERLIDAVKNILNNKGYSTKQLLVDSIDLVNTLKSRKLPVDNKYINEVAKKVELKICEKENINLDSVDKLDETTRLRIKNKVLSRLKEVIPHWKSIDYDFYRCILYTVSRLAPEYAVLKQVLTEITYDDPDFTPHSLFDFGSGVGSALWAAHSMWGNSLKEYYCVDSSADMNEVARLLLQDGKEGGEMIFKGVFMRQFLPVSNTLKYDLVISAHSFLDLPSSKERLDVVKHLWRKCNKYLVLVDHGSNAGFDALMEARDYILYLESRGSKMAHVIAPCPHDHVCPRQLDGTETACNFRVQYELLPLSKKKMTAFETYSYVILKKESRPEEIDPWPRIVRAVLKRHRHIVCRMCCSDGKLHEIVFTKSKHSRNLYRCARSSEWGDLIPGTIVPMSENIED